MNVTDGLRFKLDDLGVEWTVPDESWNQSCITYWTVGGIKWVAFESENNTLLLNASSISDLTPEQAIAATLGTGTCYDVCDDPNDFTCSECGAHMFIETDDTYTMMTSDENIIKRPNHCPNCGARVVGVRV